MKKLQVTAQVPEKKDAEGNIIQKAIPPATIEVEYGETATESIQMFGEEPMNSNAFANWKVTLQNNIRSGLKRGETQEQLQARLGGSKMGVAATKTQVDPEASYKAKFQAADPKERQRMIKELQAMAQG